MTRPSAQKAAVRIGVDLYLLPMPDALKLVEIMGRAHPLERTYGRGRHEYVLPPGGQPPWIELTLVHPGQIAREQLLALPPPKPAA